MNEVLDPTTRTVTRRVLAEVDEVETIPLVFVKSTRTISEIITLKSCVPDLHGDLKPWTREDEHIRRIEIAETIRLWERHPFHPGGEVCIADEGVHQVALTDRVKEYIERKLLVLVTEAGEVIPEF